MQAIRLLANLEIQHVGTECQSQVASKDTGPLPHTLISQAKRGPELSLGCQNLI